MEESAPLPQAAAPFEQELGNGHNPPPAAENGMGGGGIPEVPSVFLGNLDYGATTTDVEAIFGQPLQVPGVDLSQLPVGGIRVERVDLKRGYCFVYLKQCWTSVEQRDLVYNYAQRISGMHIDRVSKQIRSEFAKGDGRIKRGQDHRRTGGEIEPCDTLFVVNYHVDRTRREDLEMLFKDYGRLVRVDMRRNYAFVQFESTDEALKAKNATDGGKLDDSVLSVEFTVSKRGDRGGRRRSPERGGRGGGHGRHDDRRGRYDDRRRDRSRSRSPYYRSRYRSRSRSPRRRRSRSRSRGYDRDRDYRRRSRSYERGGDYDRDRPRGSDRGGFRADDRGYGTRGP